MKKLLQQCFLFFIVVVILGHNLGNSQVTVYRTIGPTLVFVLCFTRPRYQVSVYRTIGPLVFVCVDALRPSQQFFSHVET